MALINVYSRALTSMQFSVIGDNGEEVVQIIQGMNSIPLEVITKDCPKITQVEESIWKKIQEKYKIHVPLFGGKDHEGRNVEPLYYLAKSDKEAKMKMDDLKPLIGEKEMATKTKGIEPNKAVA